MAELTPDHWFHCHDTATHCRLVSKYAEELGEGFGSRPVDGSSRKVVDAELLRLAAMAHDWGKIEAWRPEGSPWFPGHEGISAEILEGMGAPDPLVRLVKYHGRCMTIDRFGDKAVKKLLTAIGSEDDHFTFLLLLLSDCAGFSKGGMESGYEQATIFARKAGIYDCGQCTEEQLPTYIAVVAFVAQLLEEQPWKNVKSQRKE